jgi:kelch-like protein 18
VIGGHVGDYDRRAFVTTVQVYDPATNAWTRIGSLPDARSHVHNAAAVYDGRIVLAGGKTDDEAAANEVLLYTPSTNKWTTLQSLPDGRNSGVLGLLDGKLVYATGSSGGGDFEAGTYRGTLDEP